MTTETLFLTSAPRQIVVVDWTVTDYKTLIVGIDPSTPVIVLQPGESGLAGLAKVLEAYGDLDAIHLVTHGWGGALQLGRQLVTDATLVAQADDVKAIANALKAGGDLMLYGCSVAGGSGGQQFVNDLAAMLSDVDVAASSDKTGPTQLGGDWDLEWQSGQIETVLPFSLEGMRDISHCLGCTLVTPRVGDQRYGQSAVGVKTIVDGNGTQVGSYANAGLEVFYDSTYVYDFDPSDTWNSLADFISGHPAQCGSANTAPTNISSTSLSVAENTSTASALTIGALSTTDANAGDTFTYSIVGGADQASFQISGSSLQFKSGVTLNYEAKNSYAVTVRSTDQGSLYFDKALTVTLSNVNEKPTITAPASQSVDQGVATAITGISVADPDSGSNTISVSLSAPVGTLTATSGSGVTVQGSGTASMMLVGTQANINSFIAASKVQYTTAGGATGTVTLSIGSNDGGNSGSGGAQTDSTTETLNITIANTAPTISGTPTDITVTEDTASNVDLSAVTVADADGDTLTMTLTASAGTLTASSGGGVTVGGTASAMTLTGTAASINTFLDTAANIQYTGASNAHGNDAATLTLSATDGATGFTSNPVVNLDITAVNDAPTISGTPTDITVTEDTASNVDLSAVTLADADGDTLTMTLTASAGTLAASSSGGVTVGGTASAMTLTGTAANINTFLDTASNVKYTGASNAHGNDAATLTLSATDGATGFTSNPVANLDITAVNDAPTNSVAPTLSGTAMVGNALSSTTGTWSDVDGDSLSYSYQWYRADDNSGTNQVSIVGATSSSYTLTASETNKYVKVVVTADDSHGSSTQTALSSWTQVVNAPSVSSIVRAAGASATVAGSATSVNYTVTFSQSVSGVDATDFVVTSTGTASGAVSAVSGSGATYTVSVATLAGDGSLRLDLKGSGTGIQNSGSIAIAAGYTSGETYTLDHTAPAAPAIASISDDVGNSTSDFVTNDATLTLGGTAQANATIKVYKDNVELGTSTADGSGAWIFDYTGASLAAGKYAFKATAADAAGNVSADSAVQTVVVDTAAPTAVTPSVTARATASASDTAVFATLSVTDPTNISGYTDAVAYSINGGADAGKFAIANGNELKINHMGGLTAGTYALTVRATDTAGNTYDQNLSLTVADAPTVTSIVRQTPSSNPTNADSITWRATFNQAVSNIDTADFTLSGTTATVSTVNQIGSTNAYDVTASGGDLASYNGTVTLSLAAGQNIRNGSSVALESFIPTGTDERSYDLDHTRPLITLTTAVIPNTSHVTVRSSETGTVYLVKNTVTVNSLTDITSAPDREWNAVAITAANTDTTLAATGLGDGTYVAYARDAAGNLSLISTTTVKADSTAPTLSAAAGTPADNAVNVARSQTLTLKFSEGLHGANCDLSKIYLKDVTTDTLIPATITINGSGELVISPTHSLAYSTAYYVTWEAAALKDAAGNAAAAVSDETTFNFTTEAPPPPAPTPSAPTSPSTPESPSPAGAPVGLYDGVTISGSTQTNANGTTVTTISVPVVEATRQDQPGTTNTTHADIPLAQSSTGERLIEVSLPSGVGLTAQTLQGTNKGLREILIEASQPRVDQQSTFSELLSTGIERYVTGVQDEQQVTVRTVTLTTGSNHTAPGLPIIITGADGAGENSTQHPLRQEALVIDARQLPPGTSLQLNNVEFAIVIGAARITGGDGRNFAVGDDAVQYIVLGAEDDFLRGGGGNDVVGSRGGNDQLFGDAGDDRLFGGIGDDTLQGGAGNDILQGGSSDAGQWSIALDSRGLMHLKFVADDAALAEVTSMEEVWNWSRPVELRGQVDGRVSILEQDYGRLSEFALLYRAVTGERPEAAWLETAAAGHWTTETLAQAAYNYYLAQQGSQAQALEVQMRALITQVWGAATAAEVSAGVRYLEAGGQWAEGLKLLALSDRSKVLMQDAAGNLQLTKPFALGEVGWAPASGNDQLLGGEGQDLLIGGGGANLLDGGSGTDMASFVGAIRDYQMGLKETSPGTVDLVVRNTATGDESILRNIELAQFGDQVYRGKAHPSVPLELGRFEAASTYVELVGQQTLQDMGAPASWG